MIKINLSNSQRTKIENLHYEVIYHSLGKLKSINSIIETTFKKKYTLKDLLIGDNKILSSILQDYCKLSSRKKYNFLIHFKTYFISQYEKKLAVTPKNKNSYKYREEKYNAYVLCQTLNINVCPYCNKNYTLTISDIENDIFTRPTLDHFLDKATYPFFALSLYNLIPSCHICNSHIKKSKEFKFNTHLNPYFDDFNEIKKFTTDKKLLSLINKNDDFTLVFKNKKNVLPIDETKANNNIKDLGLDTLYNSHKDKVLELVDLSRAYNEDSLQSIVDTFQETKIFKDSNDLKRLLLCHHVEDPLCQDSCPKLMI
ncbi:MAG: hypothetical protein Q9M43_07760 [Sulfurimonas sp.]|nr:hypothetical protein [Sulfurimonas sp.]